MEPGAPASLLLVHPGPRAQSLAMACPLTLAVVRRTGDEHHFWTRDRTSGPRPHPLLPSDSLTQLNLSAVCQRGQLW